MRISLFVQNSIAFAIFLKNSINFLYGFTDVSFALSILETDSFGCLFLLFRKGDCVYGKTEP